MMPDWLQYLLSRRFGLTSKDTQRFDSQAKERDRILATLQKQYDERYGH